MKVLFLIVQRFDINSGGVQMSTFKLASYFHKNGMDVGVYSFTTEGHYSPEFIDFEHADEKGLNFNAANNQKCLEMAERFQPDIIINQMPYDIKGSLLTELKARQNTLLLGCLRGSFFAVKNNLDTYRTTLLPSFAQPFFKHQLGYWMLLQIHKMKHGKDLKRILDTHDYYVLFGEPNRKEIQYFIGKYHDEKLAFIPNSIPSVLESVPVKEKRILWLSRVDYRQKHADLIVPLWKLIKDRLPEWEFDLVGGGGALEDIRKQVKEEKIERFNIYGKQKPDNYYSRSPIYLMTSSFEGFPNTLIEAQSFGSVPIVFDSYPMVREIVTPNDSVLVETLNIQKMADEVVRLVENGELHQQMMGNSLVNARKFTIDKVGEIWTNFFQSKIQQNQ